MEKNEKEKYQEDNIANYINNLGKEIGHPNLAFDEKNICSLEFDKKILVYIVYKKQKNQFTFTSPICYLQIMTLKNFISNY